MKNTWMLMKKTICSTMKGIKPQQQKKKHSRKKKDKEKKKKEIGRSPHVHETEHHFSLQIECIILLRSQTKKKMRIATSRKDKSSALISTRLR